MTQLEQLVWLNAWLLEEMPCYREQADEFAETLQEQEHLFRSLMNLRPPLPLQAEFLQVQDVVLQKQLQKNGVVTLSDLEPIPNNDSLYLWKGDITRLQVDAIVNAANCALLGCFIPRHACIDNAIHSSAGLQLRDECHAIMQKQKHEEKTGEAKITAGYNLPSKHVIHTVGPIVHGALQKEDCKFLEKCYLSCLNIARENKVNSLAFCCISTGEFHFPNQQAAEIAVKTVKAYLSKNESEMKVIFNVFKELDLQIYQELLRTNS